MNIIIAAGWNSKINAIVLVDTKEDKVCEQWEQWQKIFSEKRKNDDNVFQYTKWMRILR